MPSASVMMTRASDEPAVVLDHADEALVPGCRAALDGLRRPSGDGEGVALEAGDQPVPLDTTQVGGERDVVGGQHERDQAHEDGGDAPPHWCTTATSVGAAGVACRAKRVSWRSPAGPPPSIQRWSPSFLRTAATWASTVFVGPYQWASQTCSRIAVRLRTAPGSVARKASRSNSFAVSAISSPSRLTRRVRRSMTSAPIVCGPSSTGAVAARPPRDGPDAGGQLAHAERLGDVVVGAELEAQDAVELVAARRQHDDGDLRAGLHLAEDVAAVDVGQAEVEQHDVGRLGDGQLHGTAA